MKIKTTTLAGTVAVALLGFATDSQAIPTYITGTISFSGTSATDTGNFMTATKFTSFQDVQVGAESSLFGDYVGTHGADVTVTPFTWNPAGASTPIDPLWTFVSGGKTYSFDLNVLHMDFADPSGLLLSGSGVAHITGELDTPGKWTLSAQTIGVSAFTFSSTTEALTTVPDGTSTILLLGCAFCGVALIEKRKVKA